MYTTHIEKMVFRNHKNQSSFKDYLQNSPNPHSWNGLKWDRLSHNRTQDKIKHRPAEKKIS